jgi:glycosyltransferase involved in cell wall biosynthesis
LAPGKFLPYPTTLELPTFSAGRRSLHIAIISKEFPPFCPGGGVGTLYYHLASELLLMGNRVSVVVPGDKDHTFRQGNISVHFTPIKELAIVGGDPGFSLNLRWSICALTKLADIHAKAPIDVVDSALWDAEALSFALLPAHNRPPVVVRLVTPYLLASQINGWTPLPQTAALFVAAERALLEHADAIVPISDSIAASVEHLYQVQRSIRWHRIPCGIAYWPFFDVNSGYGAIPKLDGISQSALESSKIVLFVGRLERRKGFDLVLAAAEEFLTADAEARLVVAGRDVEGWSERLPSMIPDSLRSRIHMLGEVSDVIREKLFALAYCVLFPSRYESFGLVPLEAFVHGAPVVAARSGAIPEVVEDHISGLLFATEDSTALADAVKRLLLDPKLRASLSHGALRRVKELNSRQSAIDSYLLYDRLLRSRTIDAFPSGLSSVT